MVGWYSHVRFSSVFVFTEHARFILISQNGFCGLIYFGGIWQDFLFK